MAIGEPWTIRIHSFDNSKKSIGARNDEFASKRLLIEALGRMGIRTQDKKVIKPAATLISRIGRVYHVEVNTR